MSKLQSQSSATVDAPDIVRNVKITAPEGVVFGTKILRHGTVHDLPRGFFEEIARQGQATVAAKSYYVALTTVFINNRTYVRRDPIEYEGHINRDVLESGKIMPIPTSEVPRDLPPDPMMEKYFHVGPLVEIEATRAGHLGVAGCFAENPGDRFTLRESIAVELEVNGKCRVLEPLTAVGLEFRERLAKSDAFTRPRYVDIAQKHRRKPQPSDGTADDSPLILVRSLRAGPFGGKHREALKMFRISEQAAATAWQMGGLELLEKPGARLKKFASNYQAYRQNPVQNPFPIY